MREQAGEHEKKKRKAELAAVLEEGECWSWKQFKRKEINNREKRMYVER